MRVHLRWVATAALVSLLGGCGGETARDPTENSTSAAEYGAEPQETVDDVLPLDGNETGLDASLDANTTMDAGMDAANTMANGGPAGGSAPPAASGQEPPAIPPRPKNR